jgi:hypothetical protein
MALVIPPTSAGASAPVVTATGHNPVTATAPDAPPAAARLEAGSVIAGTVLGRDSQGFVNIRTDKGVLALQTNANLPPGSTVSLEVRVAGTRLQLVVLSVELPPGQAPTAGTGAPTGTPAGGAPGGGTTAPPTTLPAPAPLSPSASLALALTGGRLITATVVHGTYPPLPSAPASPAPLLPAGTPGAPIPGQPAATLPGGQPVSGAAPPALVPPGQTPPGPGLPGQPSPVPANGTGTSGQPAGAPAVPGAGAPPGTVPLPPSPAPQAPNASPQTSGVTPSAPTGATPSAAAPGTAAPPMPNAAPAVLPATAALPQAGAPLNMTPAALASVAALAPGSELGVRILGAALPGEPAPAAGTRPPGAPALVQGTVVAQTPAGAPVVDTAAGALVLAVKGTLPTGSTLLIEIPPQPLPLDPALGLPVNSPQQALLRLFRGWPTLASAMASLDGAGDIASLQTLAARLPQTGPGLAGGLLSIIAQLNLGETAELLTPALREALERIGKRDLADRLNGEFRQIARLAGEPAGGDWRVMFLPLRHEGELYQVNLYLRGRRRNGEPDEPDTGTRFIVEVDMTRLGPIQLDGLVHGRRFDLMLRSRVALSPGVRRDIEAIFDEARGIGGFAGTIGFQIAASFPVQPLDQAKRKSAAGGVVV